MNLLEPWIFARLAAGLVSTWLFLYAAFVGVRVLRHRSLESATEGQLLLERQAELAATAARIGGGVQLVALLLSALAADRLSQSLKGAMCGFGVVHANAWGPWAMALSIVTALAGAVFAGLLRFESQLTRPLFGTVAIASFPLALLASADLVATGSWLASLDFSVVASCCSTSLDDAGAGALLRGASARGRLPIAITALVVVAATVALARSLHARRRPVARAWLRVIGALGLLALPLGLAAVVLEVSPHVYEAPHHLCGYCLLRLDALALGYPLIGALLLGTSYAASAGLASLVAPRATEVDAVLDPFARAALGRSSVCFALFLALAVAPVIRFTILAGGRSLFP